jgi:MFS family permease
MRRSPWSTLVVLAIAQFMVVLDVTIVNVALPHIQSDLKFSANDLQWVISAYTLIFGGFLLLGGRMADLIGRRLVFVIGLVVFGASSLAAGLASTAFELILFRGIQGLGGAMLSASALTLLTVTFEHGRRRNIALGIWGGLAGLGGTMGAVVGGALVDSLSCHSESSSSSRRSSSCARAARTWTVLPAPSTSLAHFSAPWDCCPSCSASSGRNPSAGLRSRSLRFSSEASF